MNAQKNTDLNQGSGLCSSTSAGLGPLQVDQIQEADYKTKCIMSSVHDLVGKYSQNLSMCGVIGGPGQEKWHAVRHGRIWEKF